MSETLTMIYHYDLHIHSVLSPCADCLMTPNNIFNMASLKGLNIISVTDHNALKQLEVCMMLSDSYDLLFIPGVEITVKENFDVLCYFKSIKDALEVDALLEPYIEKIPTEPGLQMITDIHDDVISFYPYQLSNPLNLSIKELVKLLTPYPHILIYAHIDKAFRTGKYFIYQYPLDGIEYKNPNNKKDKYSLYSSDAHQITDILEKTKDNQIELEALTIEAFFRYFKHD